MSADSAQMLSRAGERSAALSIDLLTVSRGLSGCKAAKLGSVRAALSYARGIGVLRSLGATGVRVATVFWIEGLALAGLAWALAVLLGLPAFGVVSVIGAVVIPIGFAFDPVSLLPMLVFTFAIATLATVFGPSVQHTCQWQTPSATN